MQRTIDKQGNIIYHFKPLGKILRNTQIKFNGEKNICFLAEDTMIQDCHISFYGDDNLVFLGDGYYCKIDMDLHCGSSVFFGRNNCFNPNGTRYIAVSEGKNIIFGDMCLFSNPIAFQSLDWHLIYDRDSKRRVNFSQNIFVGDCVWIGSDVEFLKGAKVYSGSLVGLRSVVTNREFYSCAIIAGVPAKEVRQNILWSGECPKNWNQKQVEEYAILSDEEYSKILLEFDKKAFLNPDLIFKALESMELALEKLEFVYDYLYNNQQKNRFVCFRDSDINMCKLYKVKSISSFKDLQLCIDNPQKYSAIKRIQNHLSYKLGKAMIDNIKNPLGIIQMPYILFSIQKQYNQNLRDYQSKIIQNPNDKSPTLESCVDYKQALKYKEHLAYKLGNALIESSKNGIFSVPNKAINNTNFNENMCGGGGDFMVNINRL